MSTSSYHHGDLRNALMDAGERMIDADVGRRFSLRELAREAGVSHAAPYKHFADRAELVHELAVAWMTDFVDAQALVVTGEDARADLLAAGVAYVQWAAAYPARFSIVFDPAVNPGSPRSQSSDSVHSPAGAEAFFVQVRRHEELLTGLVARSVAAGALSGPVEVAARHLWATAHGMASLVVVGLIEMSAVSPALEHAVHADG